MYLIINFFLTRLDQRLRKYLITTLTLGNFAHKVFPRRRRDREQKFHINIKPSVFRGCLSRQHHLHRRFDSIRHSSFLNYSQRFMAHKKPYLPRSDTLNELWVNNLRPTSLPSSSLKGYTSFYLAWTFGFWLHHHDVLAF